MTDDNGQFWTVQLTKAASVFQIDLCLDVWGARRVSMLIAARDNGYPSLHPGDLLGAGGLTPTGFKEIPMSYRLVSREQLDHGIVRGGCCSGPMPAFALAIAAAASSGVMNPAATSAFAAVVNFEA